MKLPHDLSEVKGTLSVSMVDDNFDAIQVELSDLETKYASLFRQLEAANARMAALEAKAQKSADTHGPVYAAKPKAIAKAPTKKSPRVRGGKA
jgi:hypothetical protein